MTTKVSEMPTDLRQARKVREGVVVSDEGLCDSGDVSWNTTHPRYHKVLRRGSRFYAHDEKNESHTGDRVQIMETKPMSKLKRWRVTQVLEKAE